MTSAQTVEEVPLSAQERRPASWGEIAVAFARILASSDFPRGDLAELRRMDPDDPDAAVVWRLLARYDLLGRAQVESKWALILHGMALMTSTAAGDAAGRSAHDGAVPVGQAIFSGGDSQRSSAYYSESRLNRLLTARGPILRTLLARMFRMIAAAGQPFNWREMAAFILNEGYDEEAAEQGRRRIAREYYRAERQRTPSE
ncbi:MAG: hypothetical protein F4148_02740 [Caldilineaceae bacterium SB0675_bin_29]|uniref:Type I-E CRISPR-associated protein Cse2/CasB n=1 Tax=Caldilineaceae bacterium SB0675_bin_29 TaxID=2605266 RepID=A0A6B1FWV4_9CHLR|nr:hypothetical protein [Caldilineaceae bacterium SB0675_bin_29]